MKKKFTFVEKKQVGGLGGAVVFFIFFIHNTLIGNDAKAN